MSAQQMALPLAAARSRARPALVRVVVPAALTDAQREEYRRLIARLVDWPRTTQTQQQQQETQG